MRPIIQSPIQTMQALADKKTERARRTYRKFCTEFGVDPDVGESDSVNVGFGARDRKAGVFELHVDFDDDPDLSESWIEGVVPDFATYEHTFYAEPDEHNPTALYVIQFSV